MRYISTRGGSEPLGFRDMVLAGMARDGGLLLPERVPDVRDRLDDWRKLGYADLAVAVAESFAPDLPSAALRECVHAAYSGFRDPAVTPLRPLGDMYLLELFHGPTLAFKDLALQLLGRLFAEILAETGRELNILAATSGDTGSAAIHGVRGLPGIRIFVLHPAGRTSLLQRRQMTTVSDANVYNLAVQGSFDDCQNIVKTLFADLEYRDRHALGAVNSINFARVLAQIVYYFYAAFRVQELSGAGQVRFSVPTGNFGDIFAGYLARRMGLPIEHLLLATNENDILSRFFETGIYRPRAAVPTVSPSMDIQVASNFERYLYYAAGEDPERLRSWMETFRADGQLDLNSGAKRFRDPVFVPGRVDRAGTLATIRDGYQRYGILLDPHTAVGVHVAERFPSPAAPTICLATAHPAKFPEVVREALGHDTPQAHHPLLDALAGLPEHGSSLPADAGVVADFVAARLAAGGTG